MSANYKLAFSRLLQGGVDYELQKENFRRYLVKVFADECFDFWTQTQTMEDFTDPTEINFTAKKIWDTFLAPEAPRVVNLSGDTVSDCLEHLSHPFPNMFRNAKKEIFNLMFVNYGYEFIEREGLLEKLTNGNKERTKSSSSEEILRLSWANPIEDLSANVPQSEPPAQWRKMITPRWFKTGGPPGSLSGNNSPRNEIISNNGFTKPSLATTKSIKSNDSIFEHFSNAIRPQTSRDRKSYDFPLDPETPEPTLTQSLPKKNNSVEKSLRKSSERKFPKPNNRALKARTSKKPTNPAQSEPTSPKNFRKNNNSNSKTPETEKENNNNNIPKKLTTSSGKDSGKTSETEKENNIPKKLSASTGRVNSEPYCFRRKKNSFEVMSQPLETNPNYNRRRAFSSRRPLRHSSHSVSLEKSNSIKTLNDVENQSNKLI